MRARAGRLHASGAGAGARAQERAAQKKPISDFGGRPVRARIGEALGPSFQKLETDSARRPRSGSDSEGPACRARGADSPAAGPARWPVRTHWLAHAGKGNSDTARDPAGGAESGAGAGAARHWAELRRGHLLFGHRVGYRFTTRVVGGIASISAAMSGWVWSVWMVGWGSAWGSAWEFPPICPSVCLPVPHMTLIEFTMILCGQ